MGRLQWMVVRDMVETETASFWYDSPEVRRGEIETEDIATEVFLLPAAGHAEKEGTFTNTERLLQFREKAVNPPGDSRSESWFVHHLGATPEGQGRRRSASAPRRLDRVDVRLRDIRSASRSPTPKKSCRRSTATAPAIDR